MPETQVPIHVDVRTHSGEERVKIRVKVNGKQHALEIEPRMLLVEMLREVLDLTGTHIGCDTSYCGACTVLLDGKAVKSCTMFAVQVDGGEIATVEGLAQGGSLNALQQSFAENHGLQCGYCTPGFLMAASELFRHNSHPSDQEILKAIAGNTCRCTGYQNILKALRSVAAGNGR